MTCVAVVPAALSAAGAMTHASDAKPRRLASHDFHKIAMEEMDSVYRMALRLSGHPDEAADLVQETYVRALSARRTFRLGRHGMRPWLLKILHNAFYTRAGRRARLSIPIDETSDAADESYPQLPCDRLATLNWEDVDGRLRQAINELALPYRVVLLLWAIEGLKYREIADLLGVAFGTIMSRLHRTRVILASQLQDLARENGLPRPN